MHKLAGGFFFCFIFVLVSCKSAKEQGKTGTANTDEPQEKTAEKPAERKLDFSAGPPTIVYRTVGEYKKNVAVTLSDDKSEVVAYPGTNDVFYKGLPAYPYPLKNDYWLDNRGINKNTAFIDMSYDAYSKLPEPPSPLELYEMIIDKDPIIEICNCGNRNQFRNEIAELNDMIEDSTLTKLCKKIK